MERLPVSHPLRLISVPLETSFPLVGGGVLGQIATLALPSILAAAQSGNLSVGGVISQLVAGGAGGAILTAIIGAIKNKAMA